MNAIVIKTVFIKRKAGTVAIVAVVAVLQTNTQKITYLKQGDDLK